MVKEKVLETEVGKLGLCVFTPHYGPDHNWTVTEKKRISESLINNVYLL